VYQLLAGIKDSTLRHSALERSKYLATEWPKLDVAKQSQFIRNVMSRVIVGSASILIQIDRVRLTATLLEQKLTASSLMLTHAETTFSIEKPFQVIRRAGNVRQIASPYDPLSNREPAPSLVKAVARARDWYERIVSGEITSVEQLTGLCGIGQAYTLRILGYAKLGPAIIEALLAGKHRTDLTLEQLRDVPFDWQTQSECIGISWRPAQN